MGTYATANDMLEAYGSDLYADLDVEEGVDLSANAKLTAALASANDEADGYLRTRYTLPLATVPAKLRDAVVAIAHYYVVSKGNKRNLGETERTLYEDAIRYLTHLSTGKITLDSSVPDSAAVVLPAVVELGSDVAEEDRQGASNSNWFRNY